MSFRSKTNIIALLKEEVRKRVEEEMGKEEGEGVE